VWLELEARRINAQINGRFLGWATFTNYGWGWDLFNLIGSDLAVVRDALAGAQLEIRRTIHTYGTCAATAPPAPYEINVNLAQ
jgi:hypothetical protein